jgi:YD repeat-containing protein
MKPRFILLILSILAVNSFRGAEIKFEYDAAGNRLARRIITLRSAVINEISGEDDETVQSPQVFTAQLAQSAIRIYPNPTKGLLKVEITGNVADNPVILQVYDMNGRRLLEESNVASSVTLDLSNQPAGIYMLLLISGIEKNEWKVIKE